ncbi:hypothetical protein EMCRGX_G004303 [Ephydatia muelleri]
MPELLQKQKALYTFLYLATVTIYICRGGSERCGGALKDLHSSPFVQHVIRGNTLMMTESFINKNKGHCIVFTWCPFLETPRKACKKLLCNLSELPLVSAGRRSTTISFLLHCSMTLCC